MQTAKNFLKGSVGKRWNFGKTWLLSAVEAVVAYRIAKDKNPHIYAQILIKPCAPRYD